MTDFDQSRYSFSTGWNGYEQQSSVDCDRCETAVSEWTGNSETDAIDLDRFTALAREHERKVHGS